MNLIPMLTYAWAEPHNSNWHQTRSMNEECRTRLWAVTRYRNAPGEPELTCEFRVIVEHMPDFCGGMIVRSPQVRTNSQGNWGNNQWASPGDTEGIGLSFGWAALAQTPTRAIDLAALTGIEFWDDCDVEDYAMKSMAWSVGAVLLANCKRGFIAADVDGGRMARLVDVMTKMGQTKFLCSNVSWYGAIDDKTSDPTWNPYVSPSSGTYEGRFVAPKQATWHNANSGNQVRWMPVTLELQGEESPCEGEEGYDEYDEWDDYDESLGPERGVEYQLPEAIRVCYNTRNYVRGVPRQFWRNG